VTTPLTALAQGIYDIIVGKAAKMPSQCSRYGSCSYRGANGNVCFVGHVLSDDQAEPDGKLIAGPVEDLVQQGRLPDYLIPHVKLLGALQRIHDDRSNWTAFGSGPPDMRNMRTRLISVASQFALNTRVLDEHFPATA